MRATNRKYDNIGGLGGDELVYASPDRYGTIWVVTRNGRIFYTDRPDAPPLVEYPSQMSADGPLYYSMTDRQGNVWLRSSNGVFCLTFGRYPYRAVRQEVPSQLRCLFRDSRGRLWMAGRDDGTLRVTDGDGRDLGYLTRDGEGDCTCGRNA